MKIIFAFPSNDNPYTYELASMVKSYAKSEVLIGTEYFWNKTPEVDIVHIHWPEALFPNWRIENAQDLTSLENILKHWKQHSKIVITRHNILPHKRRSAQYEALYALVYTYADAIIHMGKVSIDDYMKRHASIHAKNAQQIHQIIPHPIYTSLPNDVSRSEARERLGIRANQLVVLAFGDIRTTEEARLLIQTFKAIPDKHKLLLVPRWKYSQHKIYKRLEYYYYKLHPKYAFGANHLGKNLVPDDQIQLYFNAADILFLPRLRSLNSGILILGFTFAKVVVGSNYGVVGEILKTTGNPVFEPDAMHTAVDAIAKAQKLSLAGKGNDNRNYADEHWSSEKIGAQHYQLYQKVTTIT